MITLLQISINFPALNGSHDDSTKKQNCCGLRLSQSISCYSLSRAKVGLLHHNRFKLRVSKERWSFLGVSRGKDGILVTQDGRKRKKRVVVVRFNQGFGFNGGGGRDNSNTARLLGNLGLAIGLTYLSMTGQLGWVLDAIVSVWLLAVLLPIVGLGAFLWWAGRDIIQGSCPNCGNDFQIFKSSLHEFVRDPVKFYNQSTTFGQAVNDFSPRSKKGKDSSIAVVDIEAEIKDVD
uniref:Uncharacterized protein n=1 Tax=Davidia involucrata TaxID=16924 RepID=A0A5B7A291_DAVIN